MVRSKTAQPGEPGSPHSDEVVRAHERILDRSPARSRFIEVRSGRRVHVIEAGEGPPVLHLHGTGTSSLSLLPLFEHLEGVRILAVDRPGFGLSDPVSVPRERYRDTAVEFVDEVIDALGLETPVLAGGSAGGLWALWYALAHPERVRRLALLTGVPLLPGTRVPVPLWITVTPVLGELLARTIKPNEKMVVRFMASMGEKGTIVCYPDLIESLVAAGNDPVAAATSFVEHRAVISPLFPRYRRALRAQPEELRGLTVPTLMIWGDQDPIGGVEAAQATATLIPKAQLEVLPAGHVPYLAHPEPVFEVLSKFVRSGNDG